MAKIKMDKVLLHAKNVMTMKVQNGISNIYPFQLMISQSNILIFQSKINLNIKSYYLKVDSNMMVMISG